MSTQDIDVDKAKELRRRDPFNREGQVKALLDVLSQRSFEFFKQCMESSKQQKYIIDMIDSFHSTLKSKERVLLELTVRSAFTQKYCGWLIFCEIPIFFVLVKGPTH